MSPMWRCRAVLPRVKEAGCGLTRGFHRSIYRPKAVHRGLIPPMPDVDWIVEPGLIDYAEAVARMESHAEAIRTAGANERIWLVEHPPVYTAGTSAKPSDLVDPGRFPVFRSGRGGQYTYHGRDSGWAISCFIWTRGGGTCATL